MNYKIELTVGDECSDGHGIIESHYYKSNYSSSDINKAYDKSVKLTGIDIVNTVAIDYGEDHINRKLYDELLSKGMRDLFNDKEWDDNTESGENERYIYTDDLCNLYIEFVKMSLPDLVMEETNLDYSSIHIGGYGLYCN